MIVGQKPVVVIRNERSSNMLVVVQNLEPAGGTSVYVSTSFSDVKNLGAVLISPGGGTPQWTLKPGEELYASADPAAAVGSTVNLAVIAQ